MTKIFVTGATGLIGTKLTKRLIEEGYEVAGLTTSEKGKEKLDNAGVKAYIGNILEYDTIEKSIGDFKPDIIMNEITDLKQVDMSANTKVRIEGTRNLVEAAIKHDVPHIQSQSIAFVYEAGDTLATEETSLDYDASGDRKITVDGVEGLEKESARLNKHVILRYGLLYGPGTWYGKDGMIYNQFINGEVTMTDGVQSFIHIDDAVETAIQALNFESGIYNVADDEPVKGDDWAKWYSNELNVTPTLNIEPAAPFERGVTNKKFKDQGGKLIYSTWKDGMHPIK
ncbi:MULTISPECIES: NAD-dependent epimerase/dehydratase family protein [Mammaliicoccus]|uniref:NAD-dependent epimerase/dehydratase family protein n=1 Tax=Mammaliicoccus TaxID=2803850 RepID=UPI000D1EF694|nr:MULTISPECIES: NAD(P)-dependent oxidoreductase [Mammaliicoccus]MCE5041183.1 NAD(P)-dependent oxidoreductase [Mammaliicoccus sciuri]MCE5057245.1 NAD(P)-dependent oxidoreductase [Mammaliicoccus sciuri]PTJ48235.1 NAD(P)-dependent oxidoreductase [Mammaliicoccus sciuri]PTK28241.1 NAD(P)-dependent oxidoreductase [Mammaliicoccus sciuri]RIN89842.1 NAD(P)-dependent oxidoreductase [Mammaliicoccus sciuri]